MNGSTVVALVAAVAVTTGVTAGVFLSAGDRHAAHAATGLRWSVGDIVTAPVADAVAVHWRGRAGDRHGGWFGHRRGGVCPEGPARTDATIDWMLAAARGYLRV